MLYFLPQQFGKFVDFESFSCLEKNYVNFCGKSLLGELKTELAASENRDFSFYFTVKNF